VFGNRITVAVTVILATFEVNILWCGPSLRLYVLMRRSCEGTGFVWMASGSGPHG